MPMNGVCIGVLCAASTATLELICEKKEAVTAVTTVSIADPALAPECSETLVSNASASSCDITAALNYLERSCLGSEACTVDAPSVIAEACPAALEGTTLTVTASISCQIPGGLDTITILVLVLYVAISLGLGATLTLDPFIQIWRHKKRAFLIGWASQFGFMPLMAFALSHALGLDVLVAIGAILCGCAPGGATSNLLTSAATARSGASRVDPSAESSRAAPTADVAHFRCFETVTIGTGSTAIQPSRSP